MSSHSALLASYYANPTLPEVTTKVDGAGACWIGPDGAAWFCPIFADGTLDVDNISALDIDNADEEVVIAVHTALGLPL